MQCLLQFDVCLFVVPASTCFSIPGLFLLFSKCPHFTSFNDPNAYCTFSGSLYLTDQSIQCSTCPHTAKNRLPVIRHRISYLILIKLLEDKDPIFPLWNTNIFLLDLSLKFLNHSDPIFHLSPLQLTHKRNWIVCSVVFQILDFAYWILVCP